jgi:hypothetical protein
MARMATTHPKDPQREAIELLVSFADDVPQETKDYYLIEREVTIIKPDPANWGGHIQIPATVKVLDAEKWYEYCTARCAIMTEFGTMDASPPTFKVQVIGGNHSREAYTRVHRDGFDDGDDKKIPKGHQCYAFLEGYSWYNDGESITNEQISHIGAMHNIATSERFETTDFDFIETLCKTLQTFPIRSC